MLYGLIFINYIDLVYSGEGYHLWLIVMYFFPFFGLSAMTFRRNFRLTLALGLIASLMNDLVYSTMGNLMFGSHYDLARYFSLWLIPSNAVIFKLNFGFTLVNVYSWMMAVSIYVRIFLIFVLIRAWKIRAEARCIDGKEQLKKTRLKFWDKIIEKI